MPSPLALTPRAVRLLIVGILVLGGLSAYRLLLAPPPGPYTSLNGTTMGTTWSVHVASEDMGASAMRSAAAAIQSSLDEVVASMSTWDPDSEISRLNASTRTDPQTISEPLLQVLKVAQAVSQASQGAFDVTVSPLVDAWGFGAATPPASLPSEKHLEEIRRHTGHGLVILDGTRSTLTKKDPRVEIDLSAIAKGYGVDRVAEKLESLGYFDYLVEVGGELRARGRRLDGKIWRVAIETPGDGLREIHRILELKDRAMATSGDYRNFYERDGQRFSHTLDPRTGRPIEHRLASVSVLHPTATAADAWATALNVLGPKKGFEVAQEENIAAYFISRTDSEGPFEVRATPAFARYWPEIHEPIASE
ncbi:MAG: FAD:protein FMN transferase [Myxococcota bacterium]|nr:FAD:protein FMN transferase [Myxococcota bacterium]